MTQTKGSPRNPGRFRYCTQFLRAADRQNQQNRNRFRYLTTYECSA
ncbi:hypothetical protein ALO83_200111 [Pseudomonas cannabina pv. alisalensis]|nr:hypothetical protein ALO83_200111 [Pseudomonas cannabina pv. alisalensis]RMN82421.1 hypothetical protein ALQ52_200088 [Pseudomonas cannabina pv. alisalensis]